MIRSAFGKVALLALTTAIAGVTLAGCSASDIGSKPSSSVEGKQGQAGLNLQPVSGVTVDTVKYVVTQGVGGAVVKQGNLSVPGTGADFSFGVPLPVGTDYHLSLSATSVDGKVTCVGGLPAGFDIVANQTIDITPTLTCTDITTGQPIVLVDVVNTACPDLTFDYVVATPKSAKLGSAINLLSNAVSASGKTVTYSWTTSAPLGAITPPTSKTPSLACTTAGALVTVTVTASNGECTKTLSTKVSCVNAACGDGVVVAPETCDTALSPTCPADCTLPVCGDGNIEAPETCEPAGTQGCDDTCKARGEVCGDGFIVGTEVCDGTHFPAGTAAGSTCTNNCHTITPPVVAAACGDGHVDAGETCDNGPAGNYAINDCGGVFGTGAIDGSANDCNPITSASCVTCEAGSECADIPGCDFLTDPAKRALCWKALDCVRDTHCATSLPGNCYCGTSGSACSTPGAANGACKAVLEAAMESTDPAVVQGNFTNPALGGGLAMLRVNCDNANCNTAAAGCL